MKTNPFLNIVTLFMIFVLCASCSSQDDAKVPHANSESIDATPEITIYETSSAVVISSLYELTQVSDIVVIGRVQSEEGIINTARFPADNSKPDPRYFTLALVYKVEVVEYLKGEADSIIYVAQKQGKFLHGETPNPDKLQQALNNAENHGYLPLKHNREYLIFLR